MLRKLLKVVGLAVLVLLAVVSIGLWRNWDMVQRVFLGGVKIYETTPPKLPAHIARPAILVFSKTNGYRHQEAIPAAGRMFSELARENGWGIYQTENGATFSPEILSRFDAVVFSNVSGDVFTPAQRAAFKAFLENGGGYVGIHAAGDASHKDWDWYVKDVIGTRFIGHPLSPQIQQATMRIEDHSDPATHGLPASLQRTDEWYSFDRSPRGIPGLTILATLDENTYRPGSFFGTAIAMGRDHPIAWRRCVGRGRVFYAAPGHVAEAYSDPTYRQFLAGAVTWAIRRAGLGCESEQP
ncbi:MAG: ThuA domain-containing protein [Sphingomonadales bacterium]|nr:ThuA domain-containing protein [Sphingomonadales bacterium]